MTDKEGNTTRIFYDETSDSGPEIRFEYDAANRLINVKDTDSNIIQQLIYDSDGRIVKEMDAGGYLSGSDENSRYGTLYSYNLAGWLTQKKVPLKKESGTIYYQITRYTYDRTGKLLTEKTSQEYITLNSEPSKWNTLYYSYDKNGNLKSVSDSNGGQIEYTYDAMGRLVQEKILMEGTKYIINGYEYDSSGNLVKKWKLVDSQYLSEGEAGTVQALTVMEYDKNGNLTKKTSPEGYVTTYEYDDNNRARYYDPAMGRFINEDTYRGQIENPSSHNLYTYCYNNPVIYIDPSGHRVEGEGGGKSKCGSGKDDKGTGKTNTVQKSSFEFNPDGTIAVAGGIAAKTAAKSTAARITAKVASKICLPLGLIVIGLELNTKYAGGDLTEEEIKAQTDSKSDKKHTPDQEALNKLGKEAENSAKKGNPISEEEAKTLDEWADEYNVDQHHKAYDGSGKHMKGGQDHTHIYNHHIPYVK